MAVSDSKDRLDDERLDDELDTEKPSLVINDDQDDPDPYAPKGVERPWKHKGPALALIIFLTRTSSSDRHATPASDHRPTSYPGSGLQLCSILARTAQEHHKKRGSRGHQREIRSDRFSRRPDQWDPTDPDRDRHRLLWSFRAESSGIDVHPRRVCRTGHRWIHRQFLYVSNERRVPSTDRELTMYVPYSILGGQIIFGLGSTTIETCQSKLYTHW